MSYSLKSLFLAAFGGLSLMLFAGAAQAGTQVYMTSCCGAGASVSIMDGMMFMEDGFLPAAQGTTAVAISPDGMTGYFGLSPKGQGGLVEVVDLMMRMVERTFPAGNGAAAIAITPDGATGYIANQNDGSVTAFDIASGAVTATLSVMPGGACLDAAAAPDGTKIYVVCQAGSGTAYQSQMAVIDTGSHSVIQMVTLPGTQKFPSHTLLAVAPQGTLAYVAGIATATQTGYATVDLTSGTVKQFVPLAATSYALMVDLLDPSALISSADGAINVLHAANGQLMLSVPLFASGKGGLAPLMGGMRVAVADVDDDMITVVDNTDGHAIATIPSGGSPARVVVSSDEMTTVTGNLSSTLITALDATTGKALSSFEAGTTPSQVVSSPDGGTAYVLDQGLNGSGSGVMAISTATGQRTANLALPGASGLAIVPDGSAVYAGSTSGTISVVNASAMTVTSTVALGSTVGACSLAASADGATVYAAYTDSTGSNRLAAIATANGAMTMSILVGSDAATLAPAVGLTPDGKRAYVTLSASGRVAIVDLLQAKLTATVQLDSGILPKAIAIDPNGKTAYLVSSGGFHGVAVFSLTNNGVTGTIAIPGQPSGIALTADGGLAYVSVIKGNAVVISTAGQKITRKLPVTNTSSAAIVSIP